MGDGDEVAEAHYRQVTDDHFKRAAAQALQNPVQQPAAADGIARKPDGDESAPPDVTPSDDGPMQQNAARRKPLPRLEVHPAGLEPATFGSVDRRSIQLS